MRSLLAPFGTAYSGFSQLRTLLYEREIFDSVKLNKPTVSVGNLTVGGTGKTPIVDYILTQSERDGLKGCVLTRGYGRRAQSGAENFLVTPQDHAQDVGDEPLWLARRHPQSSVIVGSDRVASVELAQNIDFYILDDGLQHLRVKRDIDIICLDCSRPLWHYRPLPWGYGRESFSALRRGDIIILTRANLVTPETVEALKKSMALYGVSDVYTSYLNITDCVEVSSGKAVNLKTERAFLVSGIANPQSFETLAKGAIGEIVGHEIFSDHFSYTSETLISIFSKARSHNADAILTTEKDAVKFYDLKSKFPSDLKIASLGTSLDFSPLLPKIYDLASQRFS